MFLRKAFSSAIVKHPWIKCVTILIVGFGLANSLLGQKVSFDKIFSIELRNMSPIYEGTSVKGYFMFYVEDELDRKTNQYRLMILDINLKTIGNEVIVGPKEWKLRQGSFNGIHLMFKFLDTDNQKYNYRVYDPALKLITQFELESRARDIYADASGVKLGEVLDRGLFEIHNKGFVDIKITQHVHKGYEIQYFGSDRSYQGWTCTSDPDSKWIESVDYLLHDENYLLIQVFKKATINAMEEDRFLLGIDLKTGQKKFETKLCDPNHSFWIINAIRNEKTGNYVLFGQFAEPGKNSMSDKSLGFCSIEVDPNGKILPVKKVAFADGVSKLLPVDFEGKVEDLKYIFLHNIIQLSDGKVFAIGEQYRKATGAGGKALGALALGESIFNLTTKDIMIFQFSPSFQLENVVVIEQEEKSVTIPGGTNLIDPQLIANYVLLQGGFRYDHTQIPADRLTFTTFFKQMANGIDDNGATLQAITFAQDGYFDDKIELGDGDITVLPAKSGYYLQLKYNLKLKQLDAQLEKFNQ